MEKKDFNAGHRKRLKEKFKRAPRHLAEYEILELLLTYVVPRRDTKPLAKNLLERFGSMGGVLTAGPQELELVPGVGSGVSLFFSLLQECKARECESRIQGRDVFSSPTDVASFLRSRLGNSKIEEFWLLLVDNKNRFMDFVFLSRGTVDQAPVYPREVLGLALERKVGGVILVHNHPGGDPRPSSQDDALTDRITNLGRELDIRILDHIIVSDAGYYSYREQGRIS
jgi:DNA repair protein RadC